MSNGRGVENVKECAYRDLSLAPGVNRERKHGDKKFISPEHFCAHQVAMRVSNRHALKAMQCHCNEEYRGKCESQYIDDSKQLFKKV
uniref:Protein Wnt n=1 Tax=Ascaris lumbricoides TaxID=6252 RepID=A0A0M3HN11_ASCLU